MSQDETTERRPIARSLISVYDKSGLGDLAAALHAGGVEIVSTGSTAAAISALGIPVTAVSDVTGFPECLDGRVKTLHPAIHAGVLADRRKPDHAAQLVELGIEPFDLVVVNLYPFAETVASGAKIEDCVEQIDIGGPTMVRAAAKNHPNVAVVTSPDRYAEVAEAVGVGGFTLAQRRDLAREAFVHTASYDIAVASWMGSVLAPDPSGEIFPEWVGSAWNRSTVLRYGENPHQRAALYSAQHSPPGLAQAEQLHGKEMSYNNYVDADAARRTAYDFDEPAVAIIKHANPCGIAIGSDIASAYLKAFDSDPVSAYGGVVATNRPVSEAMAQAIGDVFTEVVVAPAFDDAAIELLTRSKNVRLLRCAGVHPGRRAEWRAVSGGLLMQVADVLDSPGDESEHWTLAVGEPVDEETSADLLFAWRACRSVKSNAIVLASNGGTVGVGMGQVNRVDAARLAVERAGDGRARGSVAASDAFFPFPDALEVLTEAGIRAVVQPGGSIRDEEVAYAAQAAGVSMYVTGVRHFYH